MPQNCYMRLSDIPAVEGPKTVIKGDGEGSRGDGGAFKGLIKGVHGA